MIEKTGLYCTNIFGKVAYNISYFQQLGGQRNGYKENFQKTVL